jgi:hypothetical protein
LGAMLYEILSGRGPYEGSTSIAVLTAAMEARPTPLEKLAPRMPEALRMICARAMALDPAERPHSARELARLLEDALTSAWQDPQSRWTRAGVSALTLLALLGGAVGAVLVASRLPALEVLGFGRYPIYFWSSLAVGFIAIDVATRGRHDLGRTALVFIIITIGAGPFSMAMGMLSVLRRAQDPELLADDRAWRTLLTVGAYESIGITVMGLAFGGALIIVWEAARRSTASRASAGSPKTGTRS